MPPCQLNIEPFGLFFSPWPTGKFLSAQSPKYLTARPVFAIIFSGLRAVPAHSRSTNMQLKNKNILVGVTGGIAAYKTCTLIRLLIKEGANIRVIMTNSAKKFVHENTFSALTGRDVASDMFDESKQIDHVNLTKEADLFVIAPATANTIAKLACGLADNMLTATALACASKMMVAPAMNTNMYENPVTKENIEKLASRGYIVVNPGSGDLACGDTGPGRMAEPEEIARIITALLTDNVLEYQDNVPRLEHAQEQQLTFKQTLLLESSNLQNMRILITAGPTREYIDPVRYISNESSGKMGYTLAQTAAQKGAEVTLVSGPVNLTEPKGVRVRHVVSAEEMYDITMDEVYNHPYDIVISTAAISDFKPLRQEHSKIKKNPQNDSMDLVLVKSKDLIGTIANMDSPPFCVGFAAETDNHEDNAVRKLKDKKLDLIVLNDVSRSDIGFDSDDNAVTVFGPQGRVEDFGKMPKSILSDKLIDLIVRLYKEKTGR